MHSKRDLTRLRRYMFIKEVVMTFLVFVGFGTVIIEHLEVIEGEQLLIIDAIDVTIALIFLWEFWHEWYYARDRRKYLRYNWYYLLAAIPIPSQAIEILRGIRLLRLLRLAEEFARWRYEHNTHLFDRSRR